MTHCKIFRAHGRPGSTSTLAAMRSPARWTPRPVCTPRSSFMLWITFLLFWETCIDIDIDIDVDIGMVIGIDTDIDIEIGIDLDLGTYIHR